MKVRNYTTGELFSVPPQGSIFCPPPKSGIVPNSLCGTVPGSLFALGFPIFGANCGIKKNHKINWKPGGHIGGTVPGFLKFWCSFSDKHDLVLLFNLFWFSLVLFLLCLFFMSFVFFYFHVLVLWYFFIVALLFFDLIVYFVFFCFKLCSFCFTHFLTFLFLFIFFFCLLVILLDDICLSCNSSGKRKEGFRAETPLKLQEMFFW